MKAADVMTTDVVTIGPETSVRHIAQLMLRHRVSALPVLDDDDRLVGIVSEGDLMRRAELGRDRHRSWWLNLLAGPAEIASEYVKQHGQRAKDVMTGRIVSIDENATVGTIAAILEEKGVKRLPVLKDGRLIGIVSRADLLHAIATAKLDQCASGDDAIRRAVRTRIRDDAGVRDSTLSVTVSDGVVHLWGAAGSAAERRAAEVAAESVRGVSAVVDHTILLLDKHWGAD
jgi:CBS domain-containing protein